MKEVSTKAVRRFGLKGRLALSVSILALAATVYFLTRPPKLPPPEPLPDTSAILFSAQEEELLSFTVKRPGEEAYTVLKTYEGFQLLGQEYYVLNPEVIGQMADNLAFLNAEETFESDVMSDPSWHADDFGLNEEALEVSARFQDGRSYTLYLGSAVPGETPKDYGQLKGDAALYGFSPALREVFDHPKTWLHAVPQINFSPELLNTLTLTGPEETLSIRRIEDDIWELSSPVSYPVSSGSVESLKTHISGMRLAGFVDQASRLDLEDYGLQTPQLTVAFDLSPSLITRYDEGLEPTSADEVEAQQIVLAFGGRVRDIGYYCLFDGAVYQVTDLSMGFLPKMRAADYLSAYPVNIPLNRVNTLEVTGNDGLSKKLTVELVEEVLPNNQLSRNQNGETLYTFVFSDPSGAEIEATRAAALYESLMAIRSTGSLDASSGEPTSGEALLTVSLEYGGNRRTVKLYPYDALHAAIEVNGTVCFYTDRAYVEAALKTISQLP